MNKPPVLVRRATGLAALAVLTAALTGCTIPRQVKESVDQTRTVVAQLHKVHAQTARALERQLTEREHERQSIYMALRLQLQAQAEASKIRMMADYDRQMGEMLGIQFQRTTQRNIIPRFAVAEETALNELNDAYTLKISFSNDPALAKKVVAKANQLVAFQGQRETTIMAEFLTLEAALKKKRFEVERQVQSEASEKLQAFIEQTTRELATAAVNEDFHQRYDAKLAELDDAYFTIDHSLSDVSTYLDNEAMTSRYLGHFVKGVGEGFFDEFTSSNGPGVAGIASLFGTKGQEFAKILEQSETDMHAKVASDITDTASNLSSAQPKPTEPLPTSTQQ